MIYFDNAATSGKKPENVITAVNNALRFLSANPGRSGHDAAMKTADKVYKVREKIASFFGADGAENVIFTQNCTHSINCVLKGILTENMHTVISDLEHNAVMRPLIKSKAEYTAFKTGDTKDETFESFKNAVRENTKLVFVTGASNVSGKILPVAEIGKFCKNRGILFGVDAAQTAGVLPINMQKDNIDFLCIAPHKGLYAPMGIGVLICRKPLNNTIIEGGTGTDSFDFSQPLIMPEGFESGTVNVPAIMGIGAGIDFVGNFGINRIYKHEFSLLDMLYKRLKSNSNIELYTKQPVFGEAVAVLPFNAKNTDCYTLGEFLNKYGIAVRAGLHCAPTAHYAIGTPKSGCCRISLGIFNNKTEIERLCFILDKKLK